MLISINERGIFNVNVYIEMKTEFKILVYFYFSHSRKKSAYAQSRASVRCAHIYAKFIFYKSGYVHGKQGTHISMPSLYMRPLVSADVQGCRGRL